MRTSMLVCVAAIGLFACRGNQSPQALQVNGVESTTAEGSMDDGVFDVNCTGGPPRESSVSENMYACDKKDTRIYDIDTKYADYVWAVFAGINEQAPGQAPVPTWNDWRTWYEYDVPVAETCRLRARGTADSMPPKPNPLVDGNGNRLRYEVRYYSDDSEENENMRRMLASVTQQLQVICSGGTVITQWGRNPSRDDRIAVRPTIRLKLAWKKLSQAEQGAAREGKFISDDPAEPEEGLVAVHLAIKSATSSDWWTWATFSHVGNLKNVDGLGPLFEPCEAGKQCNTCPGHEGPTPIRRVYPPSDQVAAVNENHRKLLQKNDSPLWWYELVGVQRTENARSTVPSSHDNPHASPVYRPTFLASDIIEWDHQTEASCIGCHDKMKMWYPEPGTADARKALCDACRDGWGEVTEVPGTGQYVQNCDGREFPIDLFDVRDEDNGFSETDMFALLGRVSPPSSSSDRNATASTRSSASGLGASKTGRRAGHRSPSKP